MPIKHEQNRRTFLKTSTLAAAGLMAASAGVKKVFSAPSGWVDGMEINPDIDNLRVVACRDPSMETASPLKWDTVSQNKIVNAGRVAAVLDAMALALSQKTDAQAAWATIFRKPDAKTWQQVKVAIKVNCAGAMHPRAAIMDKICRVLNSFGVPFPNITVYDSVDDAVGTYAGFKGTLLPADIVVSNQTGIFPITVAGDPMQCTTIIQDVDILVNCGANKPHDSRWALLTMSLKNHVGTVVRALNNHGSNCPHDLTELFAINKHEVIIGNPAQGVPCKQQLCIIDSLWSSSVGLWDAIPNMSPYYLVMGTFGPALDYLTTVKIREDIMQCSHPAADLNRYITDFGYTDGDRQAISTLAPENNNGRGWVEVPAPTGIRGNLVPPFSNTGTCELVFAASRGNSRSVRLYFPAGERILDASIYTSDGSLIRSLRTSSDGTMRRFAWDGTTQSGLRVAGGQYYLRLNGMKSSKSYYIPCY